VVDISMPITYQCDIYLSTGVAPRLKDTIMISPLFFSSRLVFLVFRLELFGFDTISSTYRHNSIA